MKKVLSIGTCRVAAPVERLVREGRGAITRFPHSLHYPKQVLQTLRHYQGLPGLDRGLCYLMSEESIRKSATRQGYVDSLQREICSLKYLAEDYDQFIIELSALNEFSIPGGTYVEYFARRDLELYAHQLTSLHGAGKISVVKHSDVSVRQTPGDEYVATMREIYELLEGKPILWVSHFMADAPQKVVDTRQRCIDLVKRGAKETGGYFFDPSHAIRHLGQSVALKDDGADLAHFSGSGVDCVAEVFGEWAETKSHAWIER